MLNYNDLPPAENGDLCYKCPYYRICDFGARHYPGCYDSAVSQEAFYKLENDNS